MSALVLVLGYKPSTSLSVGGDKMARDRIGRKLIGYCEKFENKFRKVTLEGQGQTAFTSVHTSCC